MHSYGRLRVKIQRLDPLDVLLFLLTLIIGQQSELHTAFSHVRCCIVSIYLDSAPQKQQQHFL